MKYLTTINSPEDVKKLSLDELTVLAQEMREALIHRVSNYGGHFAPNFGMVEMTIALHYVFNSPQDKFVFDVSHQTYPHKMLTGRKEGYLDENHFNDISGYTNPEESEHDFFNIWHTSTSISLATGLAKARDLKGDHENIIAIIGDGSLSWGEALEWLDFAGSELNSNFIIIVNDNEQSIAENHGWIYKNLAELRETNGTAENNFFRAMGLDYRYENEGNNIEKLITFFQSVKDIDHPIVGHIHTQKGKGYPLAEQNKEAWHWVSPFDPETGKSKFSFTGEDYATLTADFLLQEIEKDKTLTVVTPAMPMTIGFTKENREKAWSQFVDTWITEEQAVAFISWIGKNGGKAVLGTNATFIQRSYDQISQDLCLNNNPATILLNYSSVWGLNDVTHLGIFNSALFSNIPNLILLAPTCKKEYFSMLNWSIHQRKHPVMITLPGNGVIDDHRTFSEDYDNINTFHIDQSWEKVAILALGDFYQMGAKLANLIERDLGFKPTLINPRFVSGIDQKVLESLKDTHELVITLEDGILEGGFWYKIASYYGPTTIKVKNYGLEKKFYDRFNADQLLDALWITPEKMIQEIEKILS